MNEFQKRYVAEKGNSIINVLGKDLDDDTVISITKDGVFIVTQIDGVEPVTNN